MENYIKIQGKRNVKKDNIFFENDYAYILLSKDNVCKKVLFDISDINKISRYKWHLHLRKSDGRYDVCSNTYKGNTGKRRYIIMARYIMDFPNNMTIDHINRNTLDNRKSNLRIVTMFENNQNKRNNTSGCVGVTWDKNRNKWYTSISGKFIGRFDKLEDAIKAREKANLSFRNTAHQE